jgi:hypothetical protein
VCTALSSTLTSVYRTTSAYAKTAQQAAAAGDLESVKHATVNFLGQFETLLEQARTGITNAGVPPVDNGAAIESQVANGFDVTVRQVRAISAVIAATSTADSAAFASRLQAMGRQLKSLSSTLAKPLDTLTAPSNKSLNQAAKNDPVCASLNR